MNDEYNLIGNGSSIFKTIGLTFAGYIIALLISHGVNFYGYESQIIQVLGVIIGLGISYIDMKYQNSFFKQNETTLEDWLAYGEKHFNLQPITEVDEDDGT